MKRLEHGVAVVPSSASILILARLGVKRSSTNGYRVDISSLERNSCHSAYETKADKVVRTVSYTNANWCQLAVSMPLRYIITLKRNMGHSAILCRSRHGYAFALLRSKVDNAKGDTQCSCHNSKDRILVAFVKRHDAEGNVRVDVLRL